MRTPRRIVVCHLLVALLVGGTALVDAGTPPADWESFRVTLTFTVATPS
jgi:hypothetical protein